jgi:PelA/Pel-15E family pectate lyase
MKSSLLLLIAAVSLHAAAVRIVLVGDSTVNDQRGWGTGFRAAFTASVEVLNHAQNGRSSKSFRDEGFWEPVLAAKPTYVLIQFGHNDQPGKGPARETEPATTYRANLARYVEEARAAGATPLLLTPIVRRNFDPTGRIHRDALVRYAASVRQLAAEIGAPLMDLFALTLAHAERLGPDGMEGIDAVTNDGKPDHTHLGPRGRAEIGRIAALEFVRAVPAMKEHLAVTWREALRQPKAWYASAEARRIAANLIEYQHSNGGWDKNIDMAAPLDDARRAGIEKLKRRGQTTIDNDATYTQLRYLARVCSATRDERYSAAFRRGFHYLLSAQYPNGGWPQFYPLRQGYYDHITYNDGAMIGVMHLLRSIAANEPDYAFLNAEDRQRAAAAVERGIRCILLTQVIVNGKRTVWCAQHHETTLAPAAARSYEHPSLSGLESAGIVGFLMGIERPSTEIRAAVEDAVRWFREVKIEGIRVVPEKGDVRLAADPNAPPLWARFYAIGANLPIFSGRDGVIRYRLSEIERERRTGYRWYVDRPRRLIEEEYPRWRARLPN